MRDHLHPAASSCGITPNHLHKIPDRPSGLDALSDFADGAGAFLLGVLDDQTMGVSSLVLSALVPGYDCFISTTPWFEVGAAVSMVITTIVLVATGIGAVIAIGRIAVKFGIKAMFRQATQALGNALRVGGSRPIGPAWTNSASTAARACSFTGETVVLMANGDLRPIEEVEVGDFVIASDPETGEQVAKEVEQVFVHEDSAVDLVVGGEVISTTEDHPFWSVTDARFERADELEPGELVLSAAGATVRVTGFTEGSTRSTVVYNLAVKDIHTFHVGSDAILVHNTCRPVGFADDAVHSAFEGMKEGHAIRHLREEGLIPNSGNLSSQVSAFQQAVSPILRSPQSTFDWRLGGASMRAFAGNVNGSPVVVFVAKEGPRMGRVITAVVPDANQIVNWGLWWAS